MKSYFPRSISLRPSRRTERVAPNQRVKDPEYLEGGFFSTRMLSAEYPLKMLWKKGFIRLLLVAGMVWMLLILFVLLVHIWSCQCSVAFFSAMCNREGKVFFMLESMGFVPRPPHRCSIPVADDPYAIVIPKQRTPDTIVQNLSYIVKDEETDGSPHSYPLFGGNISWTEREENFKLKPVMKVSWHLSGTRILPRHPSQGT